MGIRWAESAKRFIRLFSAAGRQWGDEGMFAIWQGIMLGNGCVWIGEDIASQELKVITLNGFY